MRVPTRTSRASSQVSNAGPRDILKRRDKPYGYKVEQQQIIGKKRKLDIQTSTSEKPPPSYTLVPLGTPELSELCKKLSGRRGLPVYIVNSEHRSNRDDPEKLSNHVHRIGFHFHASVVEEACDKLDYVLSHGRFVRAGDLQEQQQASYLEKVCRKYGIGMNPSAAKTTEDLNLVRGAIKELFPRIPDEDLEQIVKHAWEAGTDRVGTAKDLSLARRVQLAVIARIRHQYTDYDVLLKAFDWRYAREQVEPVSLRKLIEWRGENDGGEDNELDEMVRETIVIDDEEEDNHGNELNDLTDSFDDVSSDDSGIRSEYQAYTAGDNVRSRRQPGPYREVPQKDRIAQATDVARNKIAQARQWMQLPPTQDPSARTSTANPVHSAHAQSLATYKYATPAGNPGYMDASLYAPDTIVVDGRIMRKVVVPPQSMQAQPYGYSQNNGTSFAGTPVMRIPPSASRQATPARYVGHDQAIPSIEDVPSSRYDQSAHANQLRPMRRSGPNTPESFDASKRRRLDDDVERASPSYRTAHRDVSPARGIAPFHARGYQEVAYGNGQPWQPAHQQHATAQPREVNVVRLNTAYQSAPGSPRQGHTAFTLPGYRSQQQVQQLPDAYDPAHPSLGDERHMAQSRNPREHAYPARLETRPAAMQFPIPGHSERQDSQPQHAKWDWQSLPQQPPNDAHYASAAQRPGQPRPVPAPIHGAPAPVQTMPKETRYYSRLSGSHAPLRYAAPEVAGTNGAEYPPPQPAYANNNWAPYTGSTFQSNGVAPTHYHPR